MSSKNKKTNDAKKRSTGAGADMMKQLGFGIPDFNEPTIGDDDDDDLEAQLELMQHSTDGGGQRSKRKSNNQQKPGGAAPNLQSFQNDVNKLLKDIDRPINDEELSDVDEDELLAELQELQSDDEPDDQPQPTASKSTAPAGSSGLMSTLESRRDMYRKAVEKAKATQDTSKARRLERQCKLIEEMIQTARTGGAVNESEIPPALFVGDNGATADTKAPAPTSVSQPPPPPESLRAPPPPPVVHAAPVQRPAAPATASLPTNDSTAQKVARLKALAGDAARAGDRDKAKQYLIEAKTLENATATRAAPPVAVETDESTAEPPPSLPLRAPEPRTVLEALQQRHEELAKRHQEAVKSGDSAKARRMDRLVKQYEEAINATRRNRPFDYSELAELPGFAPIPLQPAAGKPAAAQALAPTRTAMAKRESSPSLPRPVQPQVQPVQNRPMPATSSLPQMAPPTASAANPRKEQQLQILRNRQAEFEKLALEAKNQDDRERAKQHLISSKTIKQAIDAVEGGAVIDMSQLPELPSNGFEMIRDNELTEELLQYDRNTIYRRLEEDLLRQMQLCARNQQIYAHMEGAVNAQYANQYRALEQRCATDLGRLREHAKLGSKPPVFYYEKREMNLIRVNNDLADHELEVNVLRGINLAVPSGYTAKDLITYVVIELPYPAETTQTARTRPATGSGNAEYTDAVHRFNIKRNDTKLRRIFGRKELKLSIFYKAGFLRGDRLLGIATMKLADLDQKATIHESVDVYENDHKKKAEGKLEVKIRIKEGLGPMKASELSSQQWLVIERFETTSDTRKASTSKSAAPAAPSLISTLASLASKTDVLGHMLLYLAENDFNPQQQQQQQQEELHNDIGDSSQPKKADAKTDPTASTGPLSFKVLKYEIALIEEQIEQLEDHLTPDQIQLLRKKQETFREQADRILTHLAEGGKIAMLEHAETLKQLIERYNREATACQQRNEGKKADLILKKAKLVEEEIQALVGEPAADPMEAEPEIF